MRRLATLALAAALAGCSLLPKSDTPPVKVYDFGPPPAMPAPARTPVVQPVTVPAWLEGRRIDYRLDYRNAAERASYRDSRWAADAGDLITERLRQRSARAGELDAARALRVEVEEFLQVFASPSQSQALVAVRATLVDAATGQTVRRRTFERRVDAASADAAGGTQALARAADLVIDDVLRWAAEGS
jgi:cholesterol transport system auxiliary component